MDFVLHLRLPAKLATCQKRTYFAPSPGPHAGTESAMAEGEPCWICLGEGETGDGAQARQAGGTLDSSAAPAARRRASVAPQSVAFKRGAASRQSLGPCSPRSALALTPVLSLSSFAAYSAVRVPSLRARPLPCSLAVAMLRKAVRGFVATRFPSMSMCEQRT